MCCILFYTITGNFIEAKSGTLYINRSTLCLLQLTFVITLSDIIVGEKRCTICHFCLVFQGQSKIADHLKKSYSMSDLSSDTTDGRQFRKDSVNEEEFDDETGTCLGLVLTDQL